MVDDFATALLNWWDIAGRKDLPWQQDVSPYRVWVSEIMLQQTQVATVERYYGPFLRAFPTVQSLAAAEQDAVLHLWSGLGYYTRARNLHKAAQVVIDKFAGELPDVLDDLIALPGIGRSTAGAILALASDQRHAILDGNAKRVLARVFAVEGWSGSTQNMKKLWGYAEQCTPSVRVANYTQAIMDLGATLCTRRRPDCECCPFKLRCEAYRAGAVERIPAPKPKKVKPRRAAVLVMARRNTAEVLLEKRPANGIWGGLWSFPELASLGEIDNWCLQRMGVLPAKRREWPTVEHSFSHFDFDMTPIELEFDTKASTVMEADRWLWYNTHSPDGVGLAAPVARLIDALADI